MSSCKALKYFYAINAAKHSVTRSFCSNFPDKPVEGVDLEKLPPRTHIDQATIEQLEKVSLVSFGNEKGIEVVEAAIRFADQLFLVETDNVKPLLTVLEDRTIVCREDIVTDGGYRDEILANAKITEENYFVAPPGNIPLNTKEYNIKN